MEQKNLNIQFCQYDSINELIAEDKLLLEKAIEATNGSYSPYSKFRVGAAVKLDTGEIVQGANQENAAFPSGLCAERTAIFAAHSQFPSSNIVAIALTASTQGKLLKDIVTPCGSCRQVMAESQKRSGQKIKVIMGGTEKIWIFDSVDGVLPFIFDSI